MRVQTSKEDCISHNGTLASTMVSKITANGSGVPFIITTPLQARRHMNRTSNIPSMKIWRKELMFYIVIFNSSYFFVATIVAINCELWLFSGSRVRCKTVWLSDAVRTK